ncbi:hypothetical protein N9Z78_03320 [Akkermansiaceae bacterium]|nr:hypothetical protein [Akkermansiaceae bacterium]
MNAEYTIILLRLAGLICVGLVVANFVAAPRLGYAGSLAGAEKLVRQIFVKVRIREFQLLSPLPPQLGD